MRSFLSTLCLVGAVLTCLASHAQDRVLKGKVLDKDSTPLPATNIVIKGSDRGTSASSAGEFSLSASPSASTLVFSFDINAITASHNQYKLTVGGLFVGQCT